MSETNGHARKVRHICLGMPSYGLLTPGAAIGLHRPIRRPEHNVSLLNHCSSLLASNFNGLWCWALNEARKGQCDYFAMLHDDCEPEEYWLDKLIDELEARKLDVLGVVSPIKDSRGVTSTAFAEEGASTWRVKGRLTMREVYRLPETFTSEDIGHQLLINTGCWVCKFDEAWARKVHFTINDRICWDERKQLYFAQVEPEDWYFSRLLHELGLKIGATRIVELGHQGVMKFVNTLPWGEKEFDGEYLDRSILDDRPPADWFPHRVAGWLTEDEGRELARLAEGKVVLEIGSFCGRSTICLAQKATSVGAVDTFDGRGTDVPGLTERMFQQNLRRHLIDHKVRTYIGLSEEVLPCLPPVYDLVFIDGDHEREAVARDIRLARDVLKPDGILVFHDYETGRDPGVDGPVNALLEGGAELVGRCGSLAVVRPARTDAILEPVGG